MKKLKPMMSLNCAWRKEDALGACDNPKEEAFVLIRLTSQGGVPFEYPACMRHALMMQKAGLELPPEISACTGDGVLE